MLSQISLRNLHLPLPHFGHYQELRKIQGKKPCVRCSVNLPKTDAVQGSLAYDLEGTRGEAGGQKKTGVSPVHRSKLKDLQQGPQRASEFSIQICEDISCRETRVLGMTFQQADTSCTFKYQERLYIDYI